MDAFTDCFTHGTSGGGVDGFSSPKIILSGDFVTHSLIGPKFTFKDLE